MHKKIAITKVRSRQRVEPAAVQAIAYAREYKIDYSHTYADVKTHNKASKPPVCARDWSPADRRSEAKRRNEAISGRAESPARSGTKGCAHIFKIFPLIEIYFLPPAYRLNPTKRQPWM